MYRDLHPFGCDCGGCRNERPAQNRSDPLCCESVPTTPVILTAEHCQDDDLPFGPPPPDDDEEDPEFRDPESESGGTPKDETGICEGVPFVRRTMCTPLGHGGKRIHGFEYYEPNLLTHPLAKGFAVYFQGLLESAGFSVQNLGNFRIVMAKGLVARAEHDDSREGIWISCGQEDEWLIRRITDGLIHDRCILFLDGDQMDLNMARKLGLL